MRLTTDTKHREESGGVMATMSETRLKRWRVGALATFIGMALAAVVGVGAASAQLPITDFDGETYDLDGGSPVASAQAGGSPEYGFLTFRFETKPSDEIPIFPAPVESLKDSTIELPAGLVGNPQALPKCNDHQLTFNLCPHTTQVGVIWLELGGNPIQVGALLYNMEPTRPDSPARFAFNVMFTGPIYIDASVRSDGDYGINLEVTNASQAGALISAEATLWGIPAHPRHDSDRGSTTGQPVGSDEGIACLLISDPAACSNSLNLPEVPLITLPTSCVGPVETRMSVNSWETPSVWSSASFMSHVPGDPGDLIGVEGCEDVPFEPTMELTPHTIQASSPSGFTVDLRVPRPMNADGIESAHLKDAVVTMPEGVRINPSAADGLGACSDAQIALKSKVGHSCPGSSKIGDLLVHTPVLEGPLEGEVFVGSQLPSERYRVFFVIEERGIVVKLKGVVEPNPATGQIKATFRDNPQLPFSHMEVNFKGGPRAPLSLPDTCGAHTMNAELTPWSGNAPATPSASFQVAGNCSPSSESRPFALAMQAGSTFPVAGEDSPFVLRLTRPDGAKEVERVRLANPKGLVAALRGIPYCPEEGIAQASGRTAIGEGSQELASPSCPPESRVGATTVGAGAGPSPFYVSGNVYLSGPYKGAPVSLAFIVPAVAGPFDLGVQVVRTALHVDPTSARITAVSDEIPKILHGVPLQLRDVRVNVDRPRFTRNPTSCRPMAVAGEIGGPFGAAVSLANHFQATNCAALGFKPPTNIQLFGGVKRGKYQGVRAVVRPRPGDANISRTEVRFPRSAFVAQENIRTVCTRVQWAADNCPKGSVYGRAIAHSPLLDQPLRGNVYLRSSNNPLPDAVADLRGPAHQPIKIEVAVKNDSVKGALRSTVEAAPDAPVSFFRLQMFGGKKGLIVNSRNICQGKNQAQVNMRAHNGRRSVQRVKVFNKRCQRQRNGAKQRGAKRSNLSQLRPVR